MKVNDSHCHFFSTRFFESLAVQKGFGPTGAGKIAEMLGWELPSSADELADRWCAELDRNEVGRAALIASVPGDAESVAAALARHPWRFVGFFMLDPTREEAVAETKKALSSGLRCICLFPAMHHYHAYEDRVLEIFETAALSGAAVFVHCGVLSVGLRKKMGLPSGFAMRYSNPLDLHTVALNYPQVPIIIPHFGAGLLREALMLADLCPNIYLDTSSSNSWVKYFPHLSLEDVFRSALNVLGPDRLLFGTDSSFFPRGWQRPIWEAQISALERLGISSSSKEKIFINNFNRLFPK